MSNSKSKSKTIIFNFDGTGNEPSDAGKVETDESISNVLKLHILLGGGIKDDKSNTKNGSGGKQIAHYYNGIGTRDSALGQIPLLGKILSGAKKGINMTVAPQWGDARKILREAEQDFNEVGYQKGDILVVTGFSRGAALARKFASTILNKHQNCEVSFLGVFDTVAAMDGIHRKGEKISSDVFFENGTLNDRIKKAVHLVSLDENRISFSPTLFNKDNNNSNRILEVWFPGVHSDIGGGYWYDGLSDCALAFMIKEMKKALDKSISIAGGNYASIQKLLDGQGENLYGMEVDDIEINPKSDGVVHRHSGLVVKAGAEPRRICVNDNDRPSNDLPTLHCSVKERFKKVADYRPAALRGETFQLLEEDGTKSGPITGIAGLRQS